MSNSPKSKTVSEVVETKRPCRCCGSTNYDRKIGLLIEGRQVYVCNICHPAFVEVPVEVHEEDEAVSTGTFRCDLDWSRDQPCYKVTPSLQPTSSWWKRLSNGFKKMLLTEVA